MKESQPANQSSVNRNFIMIANAGQEIKSTNYWETAFNDNGYFYVSANAGALRMLCPKGWENAVKEMQTGKEVIISCGLNRYYNRQMVELLFEDFTDSPYSMELSKEQFDRTLSPDNCATAREFSVWVCDNGVPKQAFQRPCYIRAVPRIPWLKARK